MSNSIIFNPNIIEWKWFSVPQMIQLFMYFVCKANHEPYHSDDILIDRGQVMITRKEVCFDLNMSDQIYKTCLKRLINDGKIKIFSSLFRSTLVTVLNYSNYIESTQITNQKPLVKQSKSTSLFSETIVEEAPIINQSKSLKQDVDCKFVVTLYHDRCPSLPKVLKMNERRISKVKVRFGEMGNDYAVLQEVFDKCEASHFMRGDNKRGWKADFDWIFANSINWVKILEGKYDNRTISQQLENETKQTDKYSKRRGADSAALTSEDFTESL